MDTIYLDGAEAVRAAASRMTAAAETMERAASSMQAAFDSHERFLNDYLDRLQAVLEKATEAKK